MSRKVLIFLLIASPLWALLAGFIQSPSPREGTPLFITSICDLEDGTVLMTEKGTKQLSLYSSDFSEVRKSWHFDEVPTGVAADADNIYVTTFETFGNLTVINRKTGEKIQTVKMGSGATSPIVNKKINELYVLNQFSNTVTILDLTTRKVKKSVEVVREPRCAALDKSGTLLFVPNYLPMQRADIDTVAACVSVIDLKTQKKIKDIRLYNGSNALRGVCVSSDGKYLFVTHNLGRFQVPTNQLQQGWMNTSGVSVINIEKLEHEGTVLLDDPERGAAGVWGVMCTSDKMIVSHSGTHEISIIDYPQFVEKFEAYPQKEALAYDLRFLYGIRTRVTIIGNGPRDFIVRDEKVYLPTYFSDDLNTLDLTTLDVTSKPLVVNRVETDVQRGEKYFNDANYCFQNWQSCNGCHPGDARTDGLNWDLMNDGIGNPKNCKSMLYSHVTPPSMISGIRAMAEIAVRKGYNLIQFYDVPEEKALCVDEYMKSLRPVPSPYLVDGKLSEKALKGRKVFEKLACQECHSGPYYTDLKMHRIGEDIEFENGWDTPTLIEVWRTAPYLFDGRAATMNDVFEEHKHGINQPVSKQEIECLVEYVNSL